MALLGRKRWRHVLTGLDGDCTLFGVQIFDYDWHETGETARVRDPRYHQRQKFSVYTVEIDGIVRRFAAGEFSNMVWGFYIEDPASAGTGSQRLEVDYPPNNGFWVPGTPLPGPSASGSGQAGGRGF